MRRPNGARSGQVEIGGSWTLRKGWRYHEAGWPFGKLSLTESEIVLSGLGPFRYGSRVVIRLDELVRVERLRGWSFAKRLGLLRFRTRSKATDGAAFSSLPSRIRRLERLLEDRGFTIEEVWGFTV